MAWPVDLLEETGWMTSRVWLAHGVHFNADEIARLGRAGVGVSHCAASNMVLASGICPACALEARRRRRRPRRRRLGLERFLQHDAGGAPRADDRPPALRRRQGQPLDALRWATKGSARCLGRDDIGGIAAGYEADLALFKLDELRFSGRARSARGAGSVRRASRRPGDDRGRLARRRRRSRSGSTSTARSPSTHALRGISHDARNAVRLLTGPTRSRESQG